ncbi:hypothetical protein QMO56_07130 [Roseomonas sp. E05]|nr:hypothetical protein [Roseomonas sp. E05]MDJ0387882.1 hypothetical protein [Roseomonas sp. E05]
MLDHAHHPLAGVLRVVAGVAIGVLGIVARIAVGVLRPAGHLADQAAGLLLAVAVEIAQAFLRLTGELLHGTFEAVTVHGCRSFHWG